MRWLAPEYLVLWLVVPLLVGLYLWALRRRRRYAVRFSSLALVRAALPERSAWRRHLPAALYLLAVASLIAALGRPVAEVRVPRSRTTIVLAVDVSRSMCAVDVPPNRLTVAQEAAAAFIEQQADETRVGLVAFADFAEIVVPPTNDKARLVGAVQHLTTSIGTAIGNAILKSIDAIAMVNPQVPPSGVDLESEGGDLALPPQPDIIVLLTDGANTRGTLPEDAARQAALRGIRVFTIGFGTTELSDMVCTAAQLGGEAVGPTGFGGGGFFGPLGLAPWQRFLLLDEPTLRAVAETTQGEYYRAEDAEQLVEVFRELPKKVELVREQVEVSFAFVGLGTLLVLAALALSWRWHRVP